jgi:predicted ATPase/DNA-binding CsgD family transcriptional regulator
MPPRRATRLPFYESTSFVGREREIAEVRALLTTTRLLTLTGAGGCGKTRLALRVAAEAAADHPDGTWLVELAGVADPALVPQAVAAAVGVREVPGVGLAEGLVDYLRRKAGLLVLDNCEHVVAAVACLVETLLRGCERLCVLATSRERLGSAGETTWRVPSLTVPPPSANPTVERLLGYEAVRLFVDRARAARPDFAPTARNAAALVEICRRLDGIPLAIELAAARVRVFSAEQIAARLDDRFRLLTAGPRTAVPRQQTLRATVDWSHALLARPERMLLRRLAVFAGGWTFEAAEAVAAGAGVHPDAVLDLLARLVDKSLVLADEQRGAVRYRLLETIRARAHALYREGLAIVRGMHGPGSIGNMLTGFAGLAGAQGHWVRAVRLAGACAALRESWQTPVIPLMGQILEEGLDRARQALGEATYAATWAQGRALSLEEAVAEALAPDAVPPAPAPPAGLTATELRVLRLLAEGRTTKEIAAELVVAVSTVDRHLTHIYDKLGVRNRAAATAAALKHGLV